MSYPYVFVWGSRFEGRRKGHACAVLARLPFNSALVQWTDGTRDVISRNALRKRKEALHG